MESQRSPGLYFVGEVLDVSATLGGFNFQWAWASGYAAGQYAGAPRPDRPRRGQRHRSFPLSAGWLATSSRNCAATAFFPFRQGGDEAHRKEARDDHLLRRADMLVGEGGKSQRSEGARSNGRRQSPL